MPTILVTLAAPVHVPTFAAAEHLLTMYLAVLQNFPNGLQGWVGFWVSDSDRGQRIKHALGANILMGLIASAGFAVASPRVSSVVFAGEVPLSHGLAVACGLVISDVHLRAIGGLGLVAFGRIFGITLSAIAGVVVALIAIGPCSQYGGDIGGMLVKVAAELAVVMVQAAFLRRAKRLPA